uniref:Uncharacterized protein n=1 Tax=Anopheles christyi TaxID=43041 RepID=A0A182KI21_9DIPT
MSKIIGITFFSLIIRSCNDPNCCCCSSLSVPALEGVGDGCSGLSGMNCFTSLATVIVQ